MRPVVLLIITALFCLGFNSLAQTCNQDLILFLLNAEHELSEEGVPFLKPLPANNDKEMDVEAFISTGTSIKEEPFAYYSYNDSHQLINQCVHSLSQQEEMFCWSYVYEGRALPIEMEYGSSVQRESVYSGGFSIEDEMIHLVNYKIGDTLTFEKGMDLSSGKSLSYGDVTFNYLSKSKAEMSIEDYHWEFTFGSNHEILGFHKWDSSAHELDENWSFNYNSHGLVTNVTLHNSAGKLIENWRITYDTSGRMTQQINAVNGTKLTYSYQEIY